MYGLEAISAANGWSMAFAGALIVMSGLAILSFVISQLHKIILLWENRGKYFNGKNNVEKAGDDEDSTGFQIPAVFPSDINEVACFYQPLIEQLGDSFQLSELYKIAEKYNFPHPHLTITNLRDAQILVPQGEGVFSWNQQ